MTQRFMSGAIALSAMATVFTLGSDHAQAGTMMLRLTDLVTGETSTVTGTDDDGDGMLNLTGSVGGFTLQFSTGVSRPLVDNDDRTARLRLSHTSLTTTTGGTLQVQLTDTGYDLIPGTSALWTSEIGGVADGSVSASQSVDFDNNPFGMTGANTRTITHGPFGAGAFSDTKTMSLDYLGGLFSITETVVLSLDPHSSTGFTFTSTVRTSGEITRDMIAPEPQSLTLAMMAGLAGTGMWYRNRKKSQA